MDRKFVELADITRMQRVADAMRAGYPESMVRLDAEGIAAILPLLLEMAADVNYAIGIHQQHQATYRQAVVGVRDDE